MNVVIVESGAKAKTIQKHLESLYPERSFQVLACFGHIRDLPEKQMGVDPSTWIVDYVDADKKGVIPRLKQATKDASMVYLASDPDREGEAIAYHLKERLRLKPKTYKRVTFHEITRDALARAFQNPRDIDMPLVDAQETRRILDRVVGYELSPLLWRRYCTSNLSAGRVQSTALQMIVERAKEAAQYSANVFWKISGGFGDALSPTLYFEGEEARWEQVQEAKPMFDFILQCNAKQPDAWTVRVTSKASKKSPSPPFITTTLQKEAYELYKIPSKQVMSLAQKLYESGYITYMRTDSPSMSEIARSEAATYIRDHVGAEHVFERVYATKNSHSQEAHECIRPSHMEWTSEQLQHNEELTSSHIKLYDLIWRRAIASQMVDAEYIDYEYILQHKKWTSQYTFQGTTRVLVRPGFLKVYAPKTKVDVAETKYWKGAMESGIKELQLTELRCYGDATRGQGLYHEPSIIKAMEKAGIGRPSTYASILEKLFVKKYVVLGTNPQCDVQVDDYTWTKGCDGVTHSPRKIHLGGTEKDRLVPTSLGNRVVEYLAEAYPALLDVQFTSRMENELDEISRGQRSKVAALRAFYDDFHPSIERQLHALQAVKKQSDYPRPKDAESNDENKAHKMKVLHSWPTLQCDMVATKFGSAIYDIKKKSFLSVEPYLQWKHKKQEEITERDVQFLRSFPKKIDGSTRTLVWGPYGMYVKDGKKNLTLPKESWNAVEEGTFDAAKLNQLSWTPKKRSYEARGVPE